MKRTIFVASEENVERILALREQGMNKRDIAAIMRTTTYSITRVLIANGMNKPLKKGRKLGESHNSVDPFSHHLIYIVARINMAKTPEEREALSQQVIKALDVAMKGNQKGIYGRI